MRRKENLTFQPPPSGLFSMLHTRPATGLESCVFNASQPPFFSGEAVFQIKIAVSSMRTGFCLSPTSGKLESDCSRFAVWTAVVLRFGLQSFAERTAVVCGLDWRLPTGSAGRIVNAAPAPAVLPKTKLPNYKSSRTENL